MIHPSVPHSAAGGGPAPGPQGRPSPAPSGGRGLRTVIVAGSTLDFPLEPRAPADAELLIAADSGAQALLDLGLRPHVVVGDMDSVPPETLAALRTAGVEVVQLRPDKDETDLEVALQLAVERGAGAITVFGALGGPRLDHLLASVLLLTAPYLRGHDVRLVDPRHQMFLAQQETVVEGNPGDLVTLLPLTPEVRDVRTEGLLYRLSGEPLRQAAARGVSNVLDGAVAHVRHGAGELLVIHYREEARTMSDGAKGMGAQISVYPLRQDHVGPAVEAAIGAAAGAGLTTRVQNLSTLLQGDEDAVFAALRAAFDAARAYGSTIMIATLSTGVPGDELVAEIQRDRVGSTAESGGPSPVGAATMERGA